MKPIKRFFLLLVVPLFFLCPVGTLIGQAPAPQQVEQPKTEAVYITRTGKKYHRAGCRSLRQSSMPMELKDAKAKGYTPCGICHSPK